MAPDWVPGRTLYQLHAIGAAAVPRDNPDVDAPAPSGRGLRALVPWLDHVAGLGCGAVLLTPVFVSTSHGYDTVDPLRIDQRLGDESDFVAFGAACEARDLALVLDGVFNHVGRAFPAFRDVLVRGRESAYVDWFHLDFGRDDGDGFGYATFEGHRELVTLNHDHPAVLDWAVAVAGHWLARGARGWRLDAAYAIPRPFLRAFAARVRGRHPEALLFGEVIHGDYAAFVAETGLDSVTQYELHKAIWSSFNDANLFELAWALSRHRDFAATFAPVTFAGNHDVTRLASRLADPRHLALALAVLFTVPGIPCVYYGDELAWTGVKEDRSGGDDAIRPALPADPTPLDDHQARTLDVHRRLVSFRRARPWMTQADIEVTGTANGSITYEVTGAGEGVRVSLDLDAAASAVPAGWQSVEGGDGWTIGVRSSSG